MSMKNSNDTIWNRTSDLPICTAVPWPLRYRGPNNNNNNNNNNVLWWRVAPKWHGLLEYIRTCYTRYEHCNWPRPVIWVIAQYRLVDMQLSTFHRSFLLLSLSSLRYATALQIDVGVSSEMLLLYTNLHGVVPQKTGNLIIYNHHILRYYFSSGQSNCPAHGGRKLLRYFVLWLRYSPSAWTQQRQLCRHQLSHHDGFLHAECWRHCSRTHEPHILPAVQFYNSCS